MGRRAARPTSARRPPGGASTACGRRPCARWPRRRCRRSAASTTRASSTARSTMPDSGLFYLGIARAQREFAAFCRDAVAPGSGAPPAAAPARARARRRSRPSSSPRTGRPRRSTGTPSSSWRAPRSRRRASSTRRGCATARSRATCRRRCARRRCCRRPRLDDRGALAERAARTSRRASPTRRSTTRSAGIFLESAQADLAAQSAARAKPPATRRGRSSPTCFPATSPRSQPATARARRGPRPRSPSRWCAGPTPETSPIRQVCWHRAWSAEFGGRARFVSENYGDSQLAKRFGVTRYPAIFVDDVLVATPNDFGFYGKGEAQEGGRYAPLKSAAAHERFRADLTQDDRPAPRGPQGGRARRRGARRAAAASPRCPPSRSPTSTARRCRARTWRAASSWSSSGRPGARPAAARSRWLGELKKRTATGSRSSRSRSSPTRPKVRKLAGELEAAADLGHRQRPSSSARSATSAPCRRSCSSTATGPLRRRVLRRAADAARRGRGEARRRCSSSAEDPMRDHRRWRRSPSRARPGPALARGSAPRSRRSGCIAPSRLAEGIYAFVSPETTGPIPSGNVVAIVGDDGVLVVDSGRFPALAQANGRGDPEEDRQARALPGPHALARRSHRGRLRVPGRVSRNDVRLDRLHADEDAREAGRLPAGRREERRGLRAAAPGGPREGEGPLPEERGATSRRRSRI